MKLRSPLPFFKNWKIWEKNALILSIFGYVSHFKCGFKSFQEKKTHIFSLRDFSFICCRWNVYQRALFPRKLTCPEKLCEKRFFGMLLALQFSIFLVSSFMALWFSILLVSSFIEYFLVISFQQKNEIKKGNTLT